MEDTPPHAFDCEISEEALQYAEPRGTGRCEVELETRCLFLPLLLEDSLARGVEEELLRGDLPPPFRCRPERLLPSRSTSWFKKMSRIAPFIRGGCERTLFHMPKQIFLNIPVADLARSIAFFKALGFSNNPEFSDNTGACIVISDTIYVMLATHEKFRIFTPKAICDTTQAVEVLFNLSCDSPQEVDDLVAKALAAGGTTYDQPEDLGFMYSHSFVDPDGHGWGLFHMSGKPPKP